MFKSYMEIKDIYIVRTLTPIAFLILRKPEPINWSQNVIFLLFLDEEYAIVIPNHKNFLNIVTYML